MSRCLQWEERLDNPSFERALLVSLSTQAAHARPQRTKAIPAAMLTPVMTISRCQAQTSDSRVRATR
jgi:hypothetical protein